ncbi:MAG: amidophosphoribosyltransferase [Thermoanaerobaculia bacterium]|nr:amidophosphoribosyltransferase [Thermoanaerobaculia bacterium]
MCGIFGIDGHPDAANLTYLGLYALQHRGQESAGIVSWDGRQLHAERGMGEVADIFRKETLERLPGDRAIGHTRYSTAGSSIRVNAQPLVVKTSMGPLAIVHNGNLVGAREMRAELEADGAIFQTTSDTEVILHLMARAPRRDPAESLMEALARVRGAYSVLVATDRVLIAVRDPHGFRPLVLGRFDGRPCFASESCAFDLLDVEVERELEPGEAVVVGDGERFDSYRLPGTGQPSRCAFELVYFARPDSVVFGDLVSESRLRMGARLAREAPVEADLVVPVPDSGLFAAIGYARQVGLPMEFGLIRNHYVGRTFIEPQQSIRNFGVRVKLNAVRGLLEGRRVVLIDDSIVRGTTSPKIVKMVRDAGAAEVHLRIACPPTRWPCHYGIAMPTREELIASRHEVEEIRQITGADSLAYLSLGSLLASLGSPADSYCTACWSGEYRVPVEGYDRRQADLFPIRTESEV